MEVHVNCLTKLQNTKVQKVQKVKKYIKNKNTKVQMYRNTENKETQKYKKYKTSFPEQCTMRDKVFINSVIKVNID